MKRPMMPIVGNHEKLPVVPVGMTEMNSVGAPLFAIDTLTVLWNFPDSRRGHPLSKTSMILMKEGSVSLAV